MTDCLTKYYETDKMGITHHSNYIRWMEEARIAIQEDRFGDFNEEFLRQFGEKKGF